MIAHESIGEDWRFIPLTCDIIYLDKYNHRYMYYCFWWNNDVKEGNSVKLLVGAVMTNRRGICSNLSWVGNVTKTKLDSCNSSSLSQD